jgi:hypothetical protein
MVSTEEAAGATEEAADALDSTWGSRFKLLLKGAGAALTDFGSNFGPALTGMASLASLAGSLGGGKLVSGFLGPVAGLGKKLAVRIAQQLGIAFAGTAIANAAAAGIGEGLEVGIEKAGKSSRVAGATSRVGKFLGTGLGKAFSVGFAAAAVLGVIETYNQVQEQTKAQLTEIGTGLSRQIADASVEELERSRAAVLKGLNDLYAIPDFGVVTGPAREGLIKELERINDAIRAKSIEAGVAAKEVPEQVGQGITAGTPEVTSAVQGMTGAAALEM